MSPSAEDADRDQPGHLESVRQQRLGVRAALDRLERAVAAPSAGREAEWMAGVAERERELQSAFRHHVTVTESPDGLFGEILDHSPRLAHDITRLSEEHVAIADAIANAIDFVGTASGPMGAYEVREAALDLMNGITRHRHLGASLVYEAYNVDIEAAD